MPREGVQLDSHLRAHRRRHLRFFGEDNPFRQTSGIAVLGNLPSLAWTRKINKPQFTSLTTLGNSLSLSR